MSERGICEKHIFYKLNKLDLNLIDIENILDELDMRHSIIFKTNDAQKYFMAFCLNFPIKHIKNSIKRDIEIEKMINILIGENIIKLKVTWTGDISFFAKLKNKILKHKILRYFFLFSEKNYILVRSVNFAYFYKEYKKMLTPYKLNRKLLKIKEE